MKHLTIITGLLGLVTTQLSLAQHNNEFYNNGDLVHIQSGAEVHVIGDVHMYGGTLNNYGLLKADGNLYGDASFQQRGTGTTRLQNNIANIGEQQKIVGNYAVRGGQAATGVNDGSFYNLELGNDQGIVWLEVSAIAGSTPYVADVRNSVDFNITGTVNRIITHNPAAIPANGSGYSAVFGVMNPVAGIASLIDNTISTNGNMSGVDNGYVQGKMRRAISAAGGLYPYVLGLEPAGAGAQRGVQYMRFLFAANNYDVIEGYFQTALDNTFPSAVECSGYIIDYWGGTDHGQWVFDDYTGSGTGTYEVAVWPQDDNFPTKTVWLITKDNSIQGTADQCGPTPVGLIRGGFNGFSQFGVAAADVNPLPVDLMKIWALSNTDHIEVNWVVASEHNVSHYELLRSDDGVEFEYLTQLAAAGNSTTQLSYSYDDYSVLRDKDYYYRYRSVDLDGSSEYSPIVKGRIGGGSIELGDMSLNVYPNPSNQNFNISIESDKMTSISIQVTDALGKIVQLEELQADAGYLVYTIDAMQWSTGMYHLEIRDVNSGENTVVKLIKK